MGFARELRKGIYAVGAIDWHRRLFDELIPLPDGTSYNAYVVQGADRTALIDTVDPSMEATLVENLKAAGADRIDYVVTNHAEQDHSGSLPRVLDMYPDATVITTSKCKTMLMDSLLVSESRITTVDDGETLSLGGRTLTFLHAPWVHWPETMLTYLPEEAMLFPCDFLGSHLATTDLFADDEATVYEAAKRYYAEIMMPFRTSIKKHLERLKELKIELIAPSHGPVYRNPEFILDAYRDWVSDNVKNEVVLAYLSMYGDTRRMADHLTDALVARGVTVKRFDLTRTDLGKLAIALVDAATIVFGSPIVLSGPHPNVAYAAVVANALRPKLKHAAVIGSYGWGGKLVEQIGGLLSNLKVEMLDPVLAKGFPKEPEFRALEALAEAIATRHGRI